jgi:hypothetical protein
MNILAKFRNRKIKLVLRSLETDKRIQTIKFSKQETIQLRQAAQTLGLTEQQLFHLVFKNIIDSHQELQSIES